MKASLALVSLLTAFTSNSLKSPAVPQRGEIQANTNLAIMNGADSKSAARYFTIRRMCSSYPGGDVPQERGVCSDVVIRALRSRRSICRNWFTKIWRRILLVPAKNGG
ncbi:DUF1287 domain-containing protein [Escherichia coli]|nr:DUF1287 domain-containing protein [Escherichia coli]